MSDTSARYTAEELARVLNYHGDLPVVISVTTDNASVAPLMYEFRPVLSIDRNGRRVLELMAFADDKSFSLAD